jgi:hypothetical protein
MFGRSTPRHRDDDTSFHYQIKMLFGLHKAVQIGEWIAIDEQEIGTGTCGNNPGLASFAKQRCCIAGCCTDHVSCWLNLGADGKFLQLVAVHGAQQIGAIHQRNTGSMCPGECIKPSIADPPELTE